MLLQRSVWTPLAPMLSCIALTLCIAADGRAQTTSPPSTPPPAGQAAQDVDADYPQFRWDEHPTIRFGRGSRIDFRARFQGDVRRSEAAFDEVSGEGRRALDIARRRVGIGGEIVNRVDFQVELELEATEPWRDVYANYKQFDALQLQVGHFKLPFSLDENTSSTNLDFAFRSRAADYLAPGRDTGIMAHGRVLDRIVRYELGTFRRDGGNSRTNDAERVSGGQTLAGRVVVRPFRAAKCPLREIQGGLGFTSSDVAEGFSALRGRTAFDARFYRADLYVRGRRTRVGVEVQWRPGPFSITSEYIRLTQERRSQSVEDTDLPALVATGWYASGTWAVTGEQKADGLQRPERPLFRGGIGAIELTARLESLAFGSPAAMGDASTGPRAEIVLGNADRVATVGVNWYVNRWIKIQANAIRDTLRDPAQGPLPSRPSYWSRVLRFQFTI